MPFLSKKMLQIFSSLSFSLSFGIEEVQPHTDFYMIPGRNMAVSNLVEQNFHPGQNNIISFHKITNPSSMLNDLGQYFCLSSVEKVILNKNSHTATYHKTILHGTSQGSASALNFAAKHPGKVDMLILESVVSSGNQAIADTTFKIIAPKLQNTPFLSLLAPVLNIPTARYVLPYLTKVISPFYNVTGKQPILSLDNIDKNIPIVLIHSEEDRQISIEQALAIYGGLITHGHQNVYFIPIPGKKHTNIMNKHGHTREVQAIHQVLKNHNLPYNETILPNHLSEVDLTKYQPDINKSVKEICNSHMTKTIKDIYNEHYKKETIHRTMGYGIKATLVSLLGLGTLGALTTLKSYSR